MPAFDQTPDAPQSFGYKTFWFAVRAADPASVVDALDFGPGVPANWESGLAAAYSNSRSQPPEAWAFVSPPVNGWVLVMSARFPYPVTHGGPPEIGRKFDLLFSRLMQRFDEVQFFGSHRVVGFVTWARAQDGRPVRIFGCADECLANSGRQTPEEAQLGFVKLDGLAPEEALDRIFEVAEERDAEEERTGIPAEGRHPIPDEEDVVDLAALWSIDPTQLQEQEHAAGLGLAVRLPDALTP